MINQLFKRLPTDKEFKIILKCYGIDDITNNISITYLSMKIHNTIDKLYKNLYILIDIYLPCKFRFISEITEKRTITLLRQITKLFNYRVCKYTCCGSPFYKIEPIEQQTIKIRNNVIITF